MYIQHSSKFSSAPTYGLYDYSNSTSYSSECYFISSHKQNATHKWSKKFIIMHMNRVCCPGSWVYIMFPFLINIFYFLLTQHRVVCHSANVIPNLKCNMPVLLQKTSFFILSCDLIGITVINAINYYHPNLLTFFQSLDM